MPLPTTTRGSDVNNPMPAKESLARCMDVATTPEAADYLCEQFEKRLTDAKLLTKMQGLVQKIRDFAQHVHVQHGSSGDIWSGRATVRTGHEKLRDFKTTRAIDALEGLQNIILGLAVNDSSQFMRGYASENGSLDATQQDAMDDLFNVWLAENNMVSQASTFYETDENGTIRRDGRDNKIKVPPEKVKALVNDPEKGFSAYMQAKGKDVSSRLQEYPEQKARAEKQREAQKAPEKTAEPVQASYESSSPSSSGGAGAQ